MEYTLGRMRCLSALGEWEQVEALAAERWRATSDHHAHALMAPLASESAWRLGLWDRMEKYM